MNEWRADYWNQSAGERWAKYQKEMDEALRAFGDAVLDTASLLAQSHVLDIGCGCGGTTIEAARRVGEGGAVTGIDVSRPMLSRATERAQGLQQIRFVEGDAGAYPFPHPFDAMISRFGATFFADPVAAFSHLGGHLASDGALTFVCWKALEDNEWLSVPRSAVREILVSGAPPIQAHAPGPFAFADSDYMNSVLTHAGFRSVAIAEVCDKVVLSNDGLDKAVELVSVHAGPVGRLFAQANVEEREHATRALANSLRPYAHGASVRLEGRAWLVVARAWAGDSVRPGHAAI